MTIPVDTTSDSILRKTGGWGNRNPARFDPEYAPGARNAVSVCLRVRPEEKVCVITDDATWEIAAAIVAELEKLGSPHNVWVLEDLAERPLTDLPSAIVSDLETSHVSIFAVQAQRN
ncbi:MAG: hypothetical protein ABR874_21875, partial [Candidatus Sulfotelmatobacter sp.]